MKGSRNKCHQRVSQAPPQGMMVKETPWSHCIPTLLCCVSLPPPSLHLYFWKSCLTLAQDLASLNTLRRCCICVFFNSYRDFKESDSGFLKWSFPPFVCILFSYNIPLPASSLLHALWRDNEVQRHTAQWHACLYRTDAVVSCREKVPFARTVWPPLGRGPATISTALSRTGAQTPCVSA